MQTRRNDRHADVENRALWILRRITPAGLELCSGAVGHEVRTVSHDYAADHMHLAYASTVHGIQGETTDAAVVGPGVDAAGLYVGMTRGRDHNEAIAIARSDAGARDQIADSMLRGLPEVTVDDSLRAARTELDRAARTPAPDTAAALWHDATRRPHGTIVDLDRVAHLYRRRQHALRRDLEERKDWLHLAKRRLLTMDAALAGSASVSHGRSATTTALAGERTALEDERTEKLAAYTGLLDDYRRLSLAADTAEAELVLRRGLAPEVRAAEDRARAALVNTHSAPTGPRVGLQR
ncbi:hypothetical protein ACFVSU_07525 [Microbacterium sp. NPDC058062]|uniref:hypothetical protein n=1 Tax=Microbacterium sp. NPDC058062 TaxID=3346320 RepID=UPI0036DEFAD8